MISRDFARSSWRSITPNRLWGLSWWSSWQGSFGAFAACLFLKPLSSMRVAARLRTGYSHSAAIESETDWSIRLGQALIKDASFSDALGKLARHEATLLNALTKTLWLLQQHCSATREPVTVEAVALPAAA